MRKYFVSYYFDAGKSQGHGSAQVNLEKQVRSYDDVLVISDILKKQNGFKTVAILHWCPFEIELEFSTP
jgi:hypothetical protein